MLSYIRKVLRNGRDRGASAVEYGLMVAAIAAVIVGIVFGLGTLVSNVFSSNVVRRRPPDGNPANVRLPVLSLRLVTSSCCFVESLTAGIRLSEVIGGTWP